jgi:DNA polymerase III delta prime subunit
MTTEQNILQIPAEFQYLYQLIRFRLGKYFPAQGTMEEPAVPELQHWNPALANFIAHHKLTKAEAILLLIGLSPHLHPDLFDPAIETSMKGTGDFPRIGGVRGKNFRGFLPTGETVLFLLADESWTGKQQLHQLFWSDHLFGKKKILWIEELPSGEPSMSGRLVMSQDYIDTFTHGRPVPPHFSMSFPAKKITSDLSWDDLVINEELREQINELLDWVKYNDQLMHDWGMNNRLRKGYRSLFYGPPGTGKTFTAGLLGKHTGKEVYKIDLSMVVSKYIGETEKNLELLFARAEDKGWILFFDEADALFGKRTNVRDAHDKYANQEVSYLLQRIEDYNGLIILATNMKNNIDDAFIRRFNSILKFPFPEAAERAAIWQKSFPKHAEFFKQPVPNGTTEKMKGQVSRKSAAGDIISSNGNGQTNNTDATVADVHNGATATNIQQAASERQSPEPINIPEIVKRYELSGGSILNIVHYASLKAIEKRAQHLAAQPYAAAPGEENTNAHPGANGKLPIYLTDVLEGIKKEMIKEGKPFTG